MLRNLCALATAQGLSLFSPAPPSQSESRKKVSQHTMQISLFAGDSCGFYRRAPDATLGAAKTRADNSLAAPVAKLQFDNPLSERAKRSAR